MRPARSAKRCDDPDIGEADDGGVGKVSAGKQPVVDKEDPGEDCSPSERRFVSVATR